MKKGRETNQRRRRKLAVRFSHAPSITASAVTEEHYVDVGKRKRKGGRRGERVRGEREDKGENGET